MLVSNGIAYLLIQTLSQIVYLKFDIECGRLLLKMRVPLTHVCAFDSDFYRGANGYEEFSSMVSVFFFLSLADMRDEDLGDHVSLLGLKNFYSSLPQRLAVG